MFSKNSHSLYSYSTEHTPTTTPNIHVHYTIFIFTTLTSKDLLEMRKLRPRSDFTWTERSSNMSEVTQLMSGWSRLQTKATWLSQSRYSAYDWGLSNMWTMNFQMFKLVLEKADEAETKLPTSTGSSKKQESSRKTCISVLLTMPKPLTVWITINCGKFWNRWEYQTTWPASWETCVQVRKQQLEVDMEQQTGSK